MPEGEPRVESSSEGGRPPSLQPGASFSFLRAPYLFSSNERWTLFASAVVGLLVLGALVSPEVRSVLPDCPIKRWLGLDCPGCGLTRATLSLAALDLPSALTYNPLVFFVVGYGSYLLATIGCGLVSGRRLVSNVPRWFSAGIEVAFVLVWLGVCSVRVASWLAPGLNPGGWLLPPA